MNGMCHIMQNMADADIVFPWLSKAYFDRISIFSRYHLPGTGGPSQSDVPCPGVGYDGT